MTQEEESDICTETLLHGSEKLGKFLFERQRDPLLPAERLQNLQMHSIPSAVEMVWIVKQNRVLHKFFAAQAIPLCWWCSEGASKAYKSIDF